jgi:hypothetical protein
MYKTSELSELEYKLHIFLVYPICYFQVISMLSVSRLAYLVSALAATARSGIIVMNCNQGTQSQDVDNAIKDVAEVAKGMQSIRHFHISTDVRFSCCCGSRVWQDQWQR